MNTRTSTIIAIGLIFSTINSCEKAQVKEPPHDVSPQVIESAQDISGQWMWISTWFDWAPGDSNPKTPQNSGIQEIIKFNSNKTWVKIQNNIRVDSGTYSTGHGSYLPYMGAYNFIYDSIVYYRNGISEKWTQDYYKIFNDTLQFSSGFAGIYGGGSKLYIKQK